jgi:hypothetical protein
VTEIDAFLSTWSSARNTYGEGAPQTGAQYDNSGRLTTMASNLDSAAPDQRWQGSAATSYGAANREHQRVITALADLDRRLAGEVDNSASSVEAGRRSLDELRKWVVDAASAAPPGREGDRIRTVVAQKGLAQLQEIMRQSNSESNAIGSRIRALGQEFEALGNQKFAPKQAGDGVLDVETLGEYADEKEQVAQDVEKSLKEGDQEAAGRVRDVLDSITPQQLSGAEPLTDKQQDYLSQLQHQQQSMSVADLKAAEDRLGDKGRIIGDSWQLMTNDDIDFPDAGTGAIAPDDQKFENLPQSVRDAIKSPGLLYDQQMDDIAAIVKDGDQRFQNGTEIDREMIRKADRMMDTPLFEKSTGQPGDGSRPQYDVVLQDIFESAGRDHQIVHDHITGTHGDDGDDFLHDVNHHAWNDRGRAAGSLFSWTENPVGDHEKTIAAATAEKYAAWIGDHDSELLDLPGDRTLGEVNPELVRAYAHGLGNYIPDIADLSTADPDNGFDALDVGDKDMATAKGVFSVLSTDEEASKWFNGKASAAMQAAQFEYAQAAKNNVPNLEAYNDKLLDAATLRALVDCGTVNAAYATDLNDHDKAVLAYERKVTAWEFGASAASTVGGFVPGMPGQILQGAGEMAPFLKDVFVGPAPGPAAGAPVISNLGYGEAGQLALNPLLAAGVPVHGLPEHFMVPVDPDKPDGPQRIGTVQEIRDTHSIKVPQSTWETTITNAATYTVGPAANPVDDIAQHYEDLIKKPNP